jgi:hypothetical protein
VAQDRQRLAALPKSAHPGAKKALAEIYNAENKQLALKAAKAFAADYVAKWPKAAAKITDDLDVLLAFYDFPAEHWIHLRTTNRSSPPSRPSGCGSGSPRGPAPAPPASSWRSSSSARWRAVNAPHLVVLVRAGANSRTASSSNEPTNQEVTLKPRDTPINRS